MNYHEDAPVFWPKQLKNPAAMLYAEAAWINRNPGSMKIDNRTLEALAAGSAILAAGMSGDLSQDKQSVALYAIRFHRWLEREATAERWSITQDGIEAVTHQTLTAMNEGATDRV